MKQYTRVYHSSKNQLFRARCTHKEKVVESQEPGVHRIPCECGLIYIAETGRNILIRLKEHKTNWRKPSKINLLWLNILGLTTIV
jgi:hypothetical protein